MLPDRLTIIVVLLAVAGGGQPPRRAATDSTLSVFEPNGAACEWLRVDPVAARREVVARFNGSCAGAVVAFSPDHLKALVRFNPDVTYTPGYSSSKAAKPNHAADGERAGARDRMFEVTLLDGTTAEIRFAPGIAAARTIGYGPGGELLALTVEDLDEGVQKTNKATVDGVALSWEPGEGIRAAARAWRFDRGQWRTVEIKATTTGWDYGPGERALNAAATLGPVSTEILEGRHDGKEPSAAARRMLARHRPADEGGFAAFETSAGAVYFWQVTGEFPYSTGLIVSGDGSPLDTGFSSGEIVALVARGKYLLVAAAESGAFPRLIDVTTRRTVFVSDTGRAAIFWPR